MILLGWTRVPPAVGLIIFSCALAFGPVSVLSSTSLLLPSELVGLGKKELVFYLFIYWNTKKKKYKLTFSLYGVLDLKINIHLLYIYFFIYFI